ncbi:YebC/PmpR family DNA-binding transcriptional regulator [Candidatus Sumerlaeota bacterium]
MSGHNKWASIKHKKAANDAKRGNIFTRIIREITVAAKNGGGDTSANPRLRTAIATAKAANMPGKNIDNAIKKGTGEMPGVIYEEFAYEGYGPGGVALLVDSTTDNRNRTSAEVRHAFTKYNGNLGEVGCVTWMFTRKGQILVDGAADEDELMMTALEAGAEDVVNDGESFTVATEPNACAEVQEALTEAGFTVLSSEIARIPNTTVKIEGKEAESLMRLLNALEDLDDTQSVSANFEMDDELLERLSS